MPLDGKITKYLTDGIGHYKLTPLESLLLSKGRDHTGH